MPSAIFFHGLMEGETAEIPLDVGKNLIVTLIEVGKMDQNGERNVLFEINGNRRIVKIEDKNSVTSTVKKKKTAMADPMDEKQIGSSIPGKVVAVLVKEGQEIKKGDSLMVIEAMKMETNIVAHHSGKIKSILTEVGSIVESGELVAVLE